jgi:hypothetical protein
MSVVWVELCGSTRGYDHPGKENADLTRFETRSSMTLASVFTEAEKAGCQNPISKTGSSFQNVRVPLALST